MIYTRQSSLINDRSWWRHEESEASLYWSASERRWIIEAKDVRWVSPLTNLNEDLARFPQGIQTYCNTINFGIDMSGSDLYLPDCSILVTVV